MVKFNGLPKGKSGRPGVITAKMTEAVKEAEGEWGLILEAHPARTTSYQWAQRHEGFEAATRKRDDGTYDHYLRFIGG